jgi:hypothetical protein
VLDKIRQLEAVARRLDPGPDECAAMLGEAGSHGHSGSRAAPTYVRDSGVDGFADYPLQETGAGLSELLGFFRREVDTTGILPASGGQLGYIPGGGLFPSAIGDFLADLGNRYSGVSLAGPGAARMEGSAALDVPSGRLPGRGHGDLTSGGSTATLCAGGGARRSRHQPPKVADSCIYLTGQAHHCVGKALHVAGLGSLHRRIVPMDGGYRMDVGHLGQLITEDRERGRTPWLVVVGGHHRHRRRGPDPRHRRGGPP